MRCASRLRQGLGAGVYHVPQGIMGAKHTSEMTMRAASGLPTHTSNGDEAAAAYALQAHSGTNMSPDHASAELGPCWQGGNDTPACNAPSIEHLRVSLLRCQHVHQTCRVRTVCQQAQPAAGERCVRG